MADEIDESVWYDEFWTALPDDVVDLSDDTTMGENASRLVRLFGEMFRDGLLWRDGDDIVGRWNGDDQMANRLPLDPDDQRLIRRIEHAAERADGACAAVPEEEKPA